MAAPAVCATLANVGANLADLVSDTAARIPDAPAIVVADRTVGWSELERLVRAVAGGLVARGLVRGDRVAMLVGNSPEFVYTYFGILRAGMVAVPINTGYTAREVPQLLEQSQAGLLIFDADRRALATEVAEESAVPSVEIGTVDWRRLTVGSTPPPAEPVDPEATAVLLFTSGTEGTPKGAMLSHRALRANLEQLAQLQDPPAMTSSDTVLVLLPLFHSYALNAILGMAAFTGATVVLGARSAPDEALRLVRRHRASVVATAPPMYQAWSNIAELAEALRGVRLLISGAAPLSGEVFRVFEQVAGVAVWEGYGMTEASPVITSSLAAGQPKPGAVGKPIPGVELQLRDADGEQVADGDPGEVVIRGENLFSGYWPDGHDGPDTEGWWATSDVGIIDADGDLHLVDRRSDLIIVSGFNVYPREVESVLEAMPGVTEVAVVGVADEGTGETVKAFVVASEDELDAAAVIDFARARLARFKCPTVVEFVDTLPHSATGKVAKASLRARIEGVRE